MSLNTLIISSVVTHSKYTAELLVNKLFFFFRCCIWLYDF